MVLMVIGLFKSELVRVKKPYPISPLCTSIMGIVKGSQTRILVVGSSPLTFVGDVSVPIDIEQLSRSYIGTAVVVQPGWVFSLISIILLEPVGSKSELAFCTAAACIRSFIVASDRTQISLP